MSAPAEKVLQRSGKTFHLASRLLPKQMRSDAAELYAFCRQMDDLADEAAGDAAEAQQTLAHVIQCIAHDPLGEEAAALGWPTELEARFAGISKVALRLTESLAADTGSRRIATEAELLQYAFGVAGTVGLMMCRILGAPPAGAEAAAHLGMAMQLTNIARDVREDFARDRVYLPASWVAPEAVAQALASGTGEALEQATYRLLALAEDFYARADRGMHFLPRRPRFAILSAAACYREIGVSVARDVPASWRARTVVPGARKAALITQSFARFFVPAVAERTAEPSTASAGKP